METPNITLTATLDDISGNAVDGSYLDIRLCNFGMIIPQIVGTSTVAQLSQRVLLTNGNTTGIKLWGNDQISPGTTYYAISVEDAKRNIVQSGIYRFTGTQTIDLSNAPQQGIFPPPSLPTLITEALAGSFPGRVYTTTHKNFFDYLIALYYNSGWQRPGIDYTLDATGTIVTMSFDTEDGDNIYATYTASS